MIASIGHGLFWGAVTYTLIEGTPLKHTATKQALYPSNVASGIAGFGAFYCHRLFGGGHHAMACAGITLCKVSILNISSMLAEQNKEIQQLKKKSLDSAINE